MSRREEVDYLDALMTVFIKSPHTSPGLKKQISALQKARNETLVTEEMVAVPIKVRQMTEEEIDALLEEEE